MPWGYGRVTLGTTLNFLNQPPFFCFEMHVTPTLFVHRIQSASPPNYPDCARLRLVGIALGYAEARLWESFVRVGLNGSGRLEPPEATPQASSQADA